MFIKFFNKLTPPKATGIMREDGCFAFEQKKISALGHSGGVVARCARLGAVYGVRRAGRK